MQEIEKSFGLKVFMEYEGKGVTTRCTTKRIMRKNICCANVHVLFAKLRMPFGTRVPGL